MRGLLLPNFPGISTMRPPKLFCSGFDHITWISSIIIIGIPFYLEALLSYRQHHIGFYEMMTILHYYSGRRWTHYLSCIFILNYLLAVGNFRHFDYNIIIIVIIIIAH